MARPTRQSPQAAERIAAAIARVQRHGLHAMTWMGAEWMARMTDLGSEAQAFLPERVKQDVALQNKLLRCSDLDEMRRVQAAFLQDAIDQYAVETGKMIGMAGLRSAEEG